jgi:hypothetical protein
MCRWGICLDGHPALRELWERYGEGILRGRIEALLQETGSLHFHVTIHEAPVPEQEEAEPELVELGIPTQWQAKGSDHA